MGRGKSWFELLADIEGVNYSVGFVGDALTTQAVHYYLGLLGITTPSDVHGILVGFWSTCLFGVLAWMVGQIFRRARERKQQRRYSVAGRYITEWHEDSRSGQKRKIVKACATLQQRGLRVSGEEVWGAETRESPRKWRLEGHVAEAGHLLGSYVASSHVGESMGTFLLKRVGERGDLEGGWLGYSRPNSPEFGMGIYTFKRRPEVLVEPVTDANRQNVLQLASETLSGDATTFQLLSANDPDRIVSTAAVLDSRHNGVARNRRSAARVLGFVVGELLGPGELKGVPRKAPPAWPADLLHADSAGTVGVLRAFAVHPDYRCRGIGTDLVQGAKDHLKRVGGKTVIVISANGDLADFLEYLEFSSFASIPNYWKDAEGRECLVCRQLPCRCSAVFFRCIIG